MRGSLVSKLRTPDVKRAYNKEHFSKAARNYDRATKFLSLGNDSSWKDQLISALPNLANPVVLDLACGTGDLIFRVLERYEDAKVTGVDITPEMLSLAQSRASKLGVSCSLVEGDISQLDFSQLEFTAASFDLITAGYAFRNTPCLVETVERVSELLKPGGVLAILDFAKKDNQLWQFVQAHLMKYWGGLWGTLLDKDFASHSYIGASLKLFPPQEKFIEILSAQGLVLKNRKRFMCGSVEMLILERAA